MKRDLGELADKKFDLLVIGGGFFGACAAWDAALRGLSVALVERGDFGGATSASHLKMVHGGIRYLQHGDIARIRQSCRERSVLLRIAPHMVKPLPIVVPTYGHGMRGKAALRAGFGLYDLITFDRNRHIPEKARQVPRGRFIGRDDVLGMFPDLDPNGLTGAGIFCDGQMHNPPRLVLAAVRSAADAGASVANYLEVTGLKRDSDRISLVTIRDTISGGSFDIRARVVLNASGPFAEDLLQRTLGARLPQSGVYSRDACFIVKRTLLPQGHALAVQTTTHDPDARLSRGARHFFIAPWRDYTLVGVWHVVYKSHPDTVRVTDEELQRFIGEVNQAYTGFNLRLDDVSLWNAGLVPFGENSEGAKDLRYGHRSRIIDHAETHGISNLITLIGVRFTTGRVEATHAIDLVLKKLGRTIPPTRTDASPLHGGNLDDFGALQRDSAREFAGRIPEAAMANLTTNYGTAYRDVIAAAGDDPALLQPVGSSATLPAQIRYGIREEMAHSLADVAFRRTELASGGNPGIEALSECAAHMAKELNWTPDRTRKELEAVLARFPRDSQPASVPLGK